MENEIINYLKRNNDSGHIVEHIGFHESGDYMLRGLFDTGKGYRQHHYEVGNEYHIVDKSEVDKLERQTCPSRGDAGPWTRGQNLDYWQNRSGVKCCSFCGSINPKQVLELIKTEGFKIMENTTKSYKRYVNSSKGYNKLYISHFSKDDIDEYNKLLDSYKTGVDVKTE